jgi:hypothetical protein
VHLAAFIFVLLFPRMFPYNAAAARRAALLATPQPQEPMTFVFMQPRVDTRAPKAPDRAEASDQDRLAREKEQAEKPTNPLPFSRGNSPQRVEAPPPDVARGRGPQPEPQAGPPPQQPEPPQPDSAPVKVPDSQTALALPPNNPLLQPGLGEAGRSATPGGALGNALKHLQTYTSQFKNLGGTGQFGPAIQFDSKGVEFGPWIHRFIQQVYSNWNVPQAAMSLKGHVVITFNVHKNGALTDVSVIGPCSILSFNTAAYGSLIASNPTQPLPPEYPDEKAFFTVTFYYNEPVP